MCLGTHQPLPKPIALGHKAISDCLTNAVAANDIKQDDFNQEDIEATQTIPEDSQHTEKHRNRNHHRQHHPHIIVEHHYHDHAHEPYEIYQEEHHPARGGVTIPFPMKLHAMLDGVLREGLEEWCSWQPHGRAFVVHKPKEFVTLLPKYFKLTKLASFQRQLNLYGFNRLTRGKDRGAYYHEMFLRGKPFLAHHIQRVKVKGTGVRARSNPTQEPDFWSMEWMPDGHHTIRGPSYSSFSPDTYVTSNVEAETSSFVYPAKLPVLPSSNSSTYVPIVSLCSTGKPKVSVSDSTNTIFVRPDDDVVSAFDKTFHYMDPFQPLPLGDSKQVFIPIASSQDPSAITEAEQFFHDFEFPSQFFSSQVEKDAIFGEMLESLIS
jgi:hypothetical protein